MNQLGLKLEIKQIDTTERIIEGYAAIAETIDRVADIIDSKAFAKLPDPSEVNVFIAHDFSRLPVGVPLELRFDGKGLWTKTKIFKTHAGDDLLNAAKEMLEHGQTLGMSIGYKITEATRERTPEGKTARRLLGLLIKEYSYAPSFTIAHPDALVSGVKAMTEGMNTNGGYLTADVITALRDEHRKTCKDADCSVCAALDASDPSVKDKADDTDSDVKTVDSDSPVFLGYESDEFKAARVFSSEERKKAAASGTAMPDGSYPIPDKDALERAVQSFGRAHNKSAVKRHIIKRARALGASDVLPDKWKTIAADVERKMVDPVLAGFLTKCGWGMPAGMTPTRTYGQSDDIATAARVLLDMSQWIESELDEGEASEPHAANLYRAMMLIANTLQGEIREYYGPDKSGDGEGDSDGESETSDASAGADDVGGKTLTVDEQDMGLFDIDLVLATASAASSRN